MLKKSVLGIFAIVGLTAITGLSLFLSQSSRLSQKNTVSSQASEGISRHCEANNLTTFRTCIEGVKNNTIDSVELTSLITCSATKECEFLLHSITRPILIYGKPNTQAGFKRTADHKYYIIYIYGSKNIVLRNLHFDEDMTVQCIYPSGGCLSPITVHNSQDIVLDGLQISYSKVMGVEAANNVNLTVQNSTFNSNNVFGIWSENNVGKYLNNRFTDTKSNGILHHGVSPIGNPTIISSNVFTHNHRETIFHVCGANGATPCPGGQLLVTGGSANVIIEHNTIINGRVDASPSLYGISGIEIDPNIENIFIRHNDIYNNTGSGIAMNTGSGAKNVVIEKNRLYSNYRNISVTGATVGSNCFSQTCLESFPIASKVTVSSNSNPCILGSNNICTTSFNWNPVNTTDLKVSLGSQPISVSNNTHTDSSVSNTFKQYNFFNGTSLINSISIIGIKTAAPVVVSPTPAGSPNTFPLSQVKSTTYYNFPDSIGISRNFIPDFKADLPKIKENGFNTVWFITQIDSFFADKTTEAMNEENVADLREALRFAKENNVKVILPLSYGTRQGCDALDTQNGGYSKYVRDHELLLRRIEDYADTAYIIIFTESVWDCFPNNYPTPVGGEVFAKKVRTTLGRLPLDLPTDIRSKFVMGYHDSHTPEGWNQGTPSMYDVASDPLNYKKYDFYSTGHYAAFDKSDAQIRADIDSKINRIRAFHPTIKIFSGENGSSYCPPADDIKQARVVKTIVPYFIQKGVGVNVWQWKPIFAKQSDSVQRDCAFGGHAITNPDGSLKLAAQELKSIFLGVTPILTPSPTVPTPTGSALLSRNVPVQTSKAVSANPGSLAVDGNGGTSWIAGDVAPQWIELDLGNPKTVTTMKLIVNQSPAGQTTHVIYAGSTPNPQTAVKTITGNTKIGEWLQPVFSPALQNVRYIRVQTTQSPSWIAWVELEIYGSNSTTLVTPTSTPRPPTPTQSSKCLPGFSCRTATQCYALGGRPSVTSCGQSLWCCYGK